MGRAVSVEIDDAGEGDCKALDYHGDGDCDNHGDGVGDGDSYSDGNGDDDSRRHQRQRRHKGR